jgi:hypothetical protein
LITLLDQHQQSSSRGHDRRQIAANLFRAQWQRHDFLNRSTEYSEHCGAILEKSKAWGMRVSANVRSNMAKWSHESIEATLAEMVYLFDIRAGMVETLARDAAVLCKTIGDDIKRLNEIGLADSLCCEERATEKTATRSISKSVSQLTTLSGKRES